MINGVADKISQILISEGRIPEEEKELYQYGFFLLLSKITFGILTVIIGMIVGVLWEGILFFILFTILREYAGGIHAPTEMICNVMSAVAILGALLTIRILETWGCLQVVVVLLLFCGALIGVLSPLDSEAKPLDKEEKRHYKKISCTIVLLYQFLGIVFMRIGIYDVVYVISVCIMLEAILILLGSFKVRNIL